ncbi:hypothetical protein MP228_012428 [Amoeboaphelidium protococcarum]|nr:hypothetical protein MP228_012428 [Amoeboaphelidium protococcarum]
MHEEVHWIGDSNVESADSNATDSEETADVCNHCIEISLFSNFVAIPRGLSDAYALIRSTTKNDLQVGIHRKLVGKLKTWNAGPAFADAALAIVVHRQNIRASVRNRPASPDLGHYDNQLDDFVQQLTSQQLGEPVHNWWQQLTDLSISQEHFGIIPCILQLEYQDVSLNGISHYRPSIQYLAVKTKLMVPYLPSFN